ncbi:MAG TPA: response regulator transcription factor [Candidatus Baltobacteraceae bacterium]|jgi:DNA-binding NarL/FixJ family response regulator
MSISPIPIRPTVRVAVVEGQVLFAKALCQVFASDPGLEVIGDAQTIKDIPTDGHAPDIIVIDLDGHPMDFSDTMRYCRQTVPNARVVVLSLNGHAELLQRCLSAGAEAYVLKDITPGELVRAVKAVAGGSTYVDPRIAGNVLRRQTLMPTRSALSDLSERETEIIRLIARGLSNKEIASQLSVSEKTIKNHISRIFAKLGITARTQAAIHAMKAGLV